MRSEVRGRGRGAAAPSFHAILAYSSVLWIPSLSYNEIGRHIGAGWDASNKKEKKKPEGLFSILGEAEERRGESGRSLSHPTNNSVWILGMSRLWWCLTPSQNLSNRTSYPLRSRITHSKTENDCVHWAFNMSFSRSSNPISMLTLGCLSSHP